MKGSKYNKDMRVISVDDEQIILEDFVDMLSGMPEISSVKGFTEGSKALEYIKDNEVDVAFCDINMRGMDGIAFAKKAKIIRPSVNIIFVTAYTQYSLEAMKMHASGYLVKPVMKDDIIRELADLRTPLEEKSTSRIKVQCFGNFEVYIDGVPCQFKYIKTKELLAYLIDRRGAYCTNGELLGALWEDKEVTLSLENYLRNLISDLKSVFRRAELEDLIIKKKGQICIVTSDIDCDYYRWLDGDMSAINAYSGEYMSQYSWAETTLAGIENSIG